MRLRYKVLLTISLAVLAFWLFGCQRDCGIHEHIVAVPAPSNLDGITDIPYLKTIWRVYNEQYFQNRLPMPQIDTDETIFMASTRCESDGDGCRIKFNLKYTLAPRVANFTMLHEMCHQKEWGKDVDSLGIPNPHGRLWRSCMLALDAQGAFREIMIDQYAGDIR